MNGRRWILAVLLTLLAVGLLTSGQVAWAADWPQWRGPERNGVATGSELPEVLPAAPHGLWKVHVGAGQSSPIVVGDRVFILARQGEEEVVLAFEASTGKELWRHAYPAPFVPSQAAVQYGPGPKSTMLADGGSVYSFGVRQRLLALDAKSGVVRWEKSFEDIYDPPYPEWGTAASPLLEGSLLIVPIGNTTRGTGEAHIAQGALVAYDKTTGKEVWRADGAPAYASPMAFTIGGVRQIVTQGDEAFFGVRASDGELLWSTEFETAFDQNSVTTVLYKDMLILSGYQWGTAALRVEPPTGGDRTWEVSEVWKTTLAELYMDSPVRVGDRLYFRSNKKAGSFVCLDAATGKIVWRSPGRWAAYSSVIVVGDRLLALTDAAELKVIATDPAAYRELASWEVATSATWSHLALSGSRVYVKDEENLASFDLAARTTKATDSSAMRTAAQAQRRGGARGARDTEVADATEAVETTIRQMMEAWVAGDVDRMFTYLADDFTNSSGGSKEIFRKTLFAGAGTSYDTEAMKIEWDGATASVTGVAWNAGPGMNYRLEFLVDQRDEEWRVTYIVFDSTGILKGTPGLN